MTRARGLIAGLSVLITIALAGTVGYMLTEHVGFFDAFYTTIITISTVGFGELGQGFSTAGRAITIVVVVSGVGAAIYTATAGLEFGLEAFLGGERQRRRMRAQIEALHGHVIVCGFGRVGRNVWSEFARRGDPCVVIDTAPERVQAARDRGALVVDGNATSDQVLRSAGIERARALIAAVRSDSDNLVIVLSAKSIRPELLVLARADEATNEDKLLLAGADRVVAPQVVGAHRLAALATQPELADFMDLVVQGQVVEFAVEQCPIDPGSRLIGRSLRSADIRSTSGALVLAVQRPPARVELNPPADLELAEGMVLIGLGSPEQLKALRKLATGG